VKFSEGPTRTPMYERRRKMLGTNDARKRYVPQPTFLETEGDFILTTESGNRITTEAPNA
jgi:hypothetical protein